MPRKISTGIRSVMPEGKVSIKYVKRAKMWCKTWFEYNDRTGPSQKQEWTMEKPTDKNTNHV